jgi:xanthine dehydrogenase YagS FAD-binding subunit
MRNFGYFRATSAAEAVQAGATPQVHYLAGGTNLVDLLKYRVEQPEALVDINHLPYHLIEELPGGGLRLGALVTNAATAYHAQVQARYPLLSNAILAGASAQLRNAATNGGNLNQRTRCPYFYDVAATCNKRNPGSGCAARGGHNRNLAILGTSESCIATFPSDMGVALRVLDAQVRLLGPAGERVIPLAEYHRLPGAEPWRDNNLLPGELVTAIDLPPTDFRKHYTYLKIRDRLSYAFALVSVAVALRLDEAGRIQEARVALGGVAHKPWRVPEAEAIVVGQLPSAKVFEAVADELLSGATGQGENDFKLTLARRAIVRACQQAAAGTPQSQSDKHIR